MDIRFVWAGHIARGGLRFSQPKKRLGSKRLPPTIATTLGQLLFRSLRGREAPGRWRLRDILGNTSPPSAMKNVIPTSLLPPPGLEPALKRWATGPKPEPKQASNLQCPLSMGWGIRPCQLSGHAYSTATRTGSKCHCPVPDANSFCPRGRAPKPSCTASLLRPSLIRT